MFSKLGDVLSQAISGVASLIVPPYCPICRSRLKDGEYFVCTACRYTIPLTGFCHEADNPMWRRFWGLVPIEHAAALFWYIEGSEWRKVVHKFKYEGHWIYAWKFGRWLGAELAAGGLFKDVDVVVFVPLHWIKRLRRTYDQAEYIARGVARELGVKCDYNSVRRLKNNPSQTQQHREERWNNVAGIFAVSRPKRLRGKHILLVDDVFTTGSTIISCAESILAACEGDVRISVATVAVSHKELGED